MGAAMTVMRDEEAQQELHAKEQLAVLEKMANAQLQNNKDRILHGYADDQELHTGTVVARIQKVYANASSKSSGDIRGCIQDFFDGDVKEGFYKLVMAGVDTLLGNFSIGESETEDMLIIFENDALVRVDVYYWKWNFSSKDIVKKVQNVFAVYCLKRVIDTDKVPLDVIIWAIDRMLKAKGMTQDDECLDYIRDILEKLHKMKKALKD